MQQPTQTSIITTYGPLGLSALVIIGVLIGWLIGRIDTTAAMSIVIPILASWGVVGVSLKQSLSAMQISAAATAQRTMTTSAYVPRSQRPPSALPMPPREDEEPPTRPGA